MRPDRPNQLNDELTRTRPGGLQFGGRMFRAVFILALIVSPFARATPLIDQLTPGDAASEKAHAATAVNSDVVKGSFDQPARVLLPSPERSWEGGNISFTMKVDPDRLTYLTARFWGGDPNPTSLILFCEGKQVGYRHLGDVDIL